MISSHPGVQWPLWCSPESGLPGFPRYGGGFS